MGYPFIQFVYEQKALGLKSNVIYRSNHKTSIYEQCVLLSYRPKNLILASSASEVQRMIKMGGCRDNIHYPDWFVDRCKGIRYKTAICVYIADKESDAMKLCLIPMLLHRCGCPVYDPTKVIWVEKEEMAMDE